MESFIGPIGCILACTLTIVFVIVFMVTDSSAATKRQEFWTTR